MNLFRHNTPLAQVAQIVNLAPWELLLRRVLLLTPCPGWI